jgi:hypothetical protein
MQHEQIRLFILDSLPSEALKDYLERSFRIPTKRCVSDRSLSWIRSDSKFQQWCSSNSSMLLDITVTGSGRALHGVAYSAHVGFTVGRIVLFWRADNKNWLERDGYGVESHILRTFLFQIIQQSGSKDRIVYVTATFLRALEESLTKQSKDAIQIESGDIWKYFWQADEKITSQLWTALALTVVKLKLKLHIVVDCQLSEPDEFEPGVESCFRYFLTAVKDQSKVLWIHPDYGYASLNNLVSCYPHRPIIRYPEEIQGMCFGDLGVRYCKC